MDGWMDWWWMDGLLNQVFSPSWYQGCYWILIFFTIISSLMAALECTFHCVWFSVIVLFLFSRSGVRKRQLKRWKTTVQFKTSSGWVTCRRERRAKRNNTNHVTSPLKTSKLVMLPPGRDYLHPDVYLSITPALPPTYSRAAGNLLESELWERTVFIQLPTDKHAHRHAHTHSLTLTDPHAFASCSWSLAVPPQLLLPLQSLTMKRPKQQTGPLSFLNFFSRKPKSEPRPERPMEARPKEEVAITLTPSEHPELVRLTCSIFLEKANRWSIYLSACLSLCRYYYSLLVFFIRSWKYFRCFFFFYYLVFQQLIEHKGKL